MSPGTCYVIRGLFRPHTEAGGVSVLVINNNSRLTKAGQKVLSNFVHTFSNLPSDWGRKFVRHLDCRTPKRHGQGACSACSGIKLPITVNFKMVFKINSLKLLQMKTLLAVMFPQRGNFWGAEAGNPRHQPQCICKTKSREKQKSEEVIPSTFLQHALQHRGRRNLV